MSVLADIESPLLEVTDLKTHFFLQESRKHTLIRRAVDGVHWTMKRGRILGVVGESGCGKSVASLSVMRLITPPGRIVGGQILFKGRDLLTLTEPQMQKVRGAHISMIFQEPMTSLNPVFTVGAQTAEVFRIHQGLSRRDAWDAAIRMLERVHIPEAARRAKDYPHQMSGGMRQRVMIAMALACGPELLIADEPTTALDVTVQAQILYLLCELQQKENAAVMMITHDLGVIAETADDVMVMYAGQVVEQAPVKNLFEQPKHPYTQGLMKCAPVLRKTIDPAQRLEPIPGAVPDSSQYPHGCRFAPRCPSALPKCKEPQHLESVSDTSEITKISASIRCCRWREI